MDKNSAIAFNFEQLDVYRQGIDLVSDIYVLTKRFPREEMFGLTGQLRRAAVSIASNVAEGSARTNKEFAHFVIIARGSVLECVTLLEIAYRQHYIAEKEFMEVKGKLVRLSKMLSGLRRVVNHKPMPKTQNPKSQTPNPEPRTPNPELPTGFTLIELVVAIGLLALVISFAGVIFRVSVDSQRTAAANAEILQKLRVITEQLDADFKGGAYEYPGFLGMNTQQTTIAGKTVTVNSDSIAFFAAGDFQSSQRYGGQTVVGNVACIFYGQPDPNSYPGLPKPRDKILLRRQTILTASAPAAASDPRGEYYQKSLSTWVVNPPFADNSDWVKRPIIDPNDPKGYLSMYLAKGVDKFTIEFAEWDSAAHRIAWRRKGQSSSDTIRTNAFKFEFTLYDSKGIFRNGRTFTHMVFVGG